jgi:hypothetical protein
MEYSAVFVLRQPGLCLVVGDAAYCRTQRGGCDLMWSIWNIKEQLKMAC